MNLNKKAFQLERTDRAVAIMSSDRVVMRPIVNRMTDRRL